MALSKLLSLMSAALVFWIAFRMLPTVIGPAVAAWRLGPKSHGQPVADIQGWGTAFDPLGDCSMECDGTTLVIGVPGTLHDFSVERGRVDAPRLLREVEGDFVADVTVAGYTAPQVGRTSTSYLPYHGAGLLIWLDRDNYIRLERAAIYRDGGLFHYVNFELRTNANMESSFGKGVEEGPIALRLERRGRHITAAYRVEGQDEVKLKRGLSVRGWGDSLQVGVAAVNTAAAPFDAELRDFRVGLAPD